MSNEKLIYTKAISNGRLRATKMGVGESVTGTLKSVDEETKSTKDGREFNSITITLEVQGRDVVIDTAGNLKFFPDDLQKGRYEIGAFTTITRVDDVTTKSGFKSSKFAVSQGAGNNSLPVAPPANAPSTKEKLQAIRNNKAN